MTEVWMRTVALRREALEQRGERAAPARASAQVSGGAPELAAAGVARTPPRPATDVELAGVHALTWLATANAVGVLLALLLSWPRLGELLGPFGYGRWVPLHTDLQLYGWCSLPLVALLLRSYRPPQGECPGGRLAVGAWSAALLVGSVSWLAGESSGKLFLEWSGVARLSMPLAMLLLLGSLGLGQARRSRARRELDRRSARSLSAAWLLRPALLLCLATVPFVLYWAAGPSVYPPFNPDSGGATGSSLLGSSLGIVALLLLAPVLAGLEPRPGALPTRARRAIPWVLVLHLAAFSVAGHGQRSHHELAQQLALASLALWVPLVVGWLRGSAWPEGSRRWLAAAASWSGTLLLTSLVTFSPGVLERLKFTNALVGHAHLAMAGAITSFHGALLHAVHRGDRLAGVLRPRGPFVVWQIGCAAQVAALLALGVFEAADPGRLFRQDAVAAWCYDVRLLGGAAMLAASIVWLRRAWRALGVAAAGDARTVAA
jgi:cytochrome c oxidase cbb3-type subunit 1